MYYINCENNCPQYCNFHLYSLRFVLFPRKESSLAFHPRSYLLLAPSQLPRFNSQTMASNRARRIAKEIADIHADTHSQITAEPVGNDDDITHLRGTFPGPPGTPYEGGTYAVDIKIPTDYPFRPPVMKFQTKVWHPNVSSQTVSAGASLFQSSSKSES